MVARNFIPVRIVPSDNLPMLRALNADPMVIKTARSDTLNGLVDLMSQALAAAPHFTATSLLLYGERDQIVPRAPVERFVASLPRGAEARQRLALYPHGYHLLTRDIEGPHVVADIVAWIEDKSAALPSSADINGRARLAGRPTAPPTRAKRARARVGGARRT